MRSDPVPRQLFSRNRAKLTAILPAGSLAVVCSGPVVRRNGDTNYPYRQDSDFFYLTGIFQEESTLVLSPGKEVLFIRQPDPGTGLWSGPLLTREDATVFSGIGEVMWNDQLDGYLNEVVPGTTGLYINFVPGVGAGAGRSSRGLSRVVAASPAGEVAERMGKLFPRVEPVPLGSMMTRLRMVKEPEEVEEIRKACAITGSAFSRVLGHLKPGMREFEVEAEMTAEFLRMGSGGHAFEPIVAAGKNALTLHYVKNDGTCREGELLLLDFGAEVNNYAADCSRTIPVGGRFTRRQRQLYDSVLRVFTRARSLMVPGTTLPDLHEQVGILWEEEHIALGLYSAREAAEQPEHDPLWKRYFMHGTSHSLGLDVHDPFDRSLGLREGMVLTCEPAIYLKEEETGIRLENDILITAGGPVDLMEEIPMDAGMIESLMRGTNG